ncbi:LOB domain-containing protein 20 [Cinnamomum micranthum f. kanehirae]|uniref:LOB domain-containing protein 20 n=1 Tax=Cinnamomum micranthum f. kanehirae TaxID=337451 RepID=A0A3S3P8G6_9MAGN|nr:LOB domain-containing protein 20 [Cinnamomum micranthum f. kanehirae]
MHPSLSPLPHPSLPPSPPFPHSINPNYPIIDDRNTTTTTTTTIIDNMDSSADRASDKSWDRRRGTSKKVAQVNVDGGKRGSVVVKPRDELAATADGPPLAPATSPCGACKFLRRKCVSGCVFAPYFGSDQGAARFAAVHKVFGASNVSKLLLHIPAHRRHDAVVTISYEAQARLSDPVYGCVSAILALQQQVTTLQMELSVVQTQLMNSRLAIANALQVQQQQQQQQQNIAVLQPAYSNNSVTSNNLVNISTFPSSFDLTDTAPSSRSFEPLQITQPLQDEEEDEEESGNPIIFADAFLQQRVI